MTEFTTIHLTRGYTTKVDPTEFKRANALTWHACGKAPNIYAARRSKGSYLYLHRWLTGAKDGAVVDHINGDTLDNRSSNLRICSHAENLQNRGAQQNNTSGCKGVSWNTRDRKWEVRIQVNRVGKFIGLFGSLTRAKAAYATAAKALHGHFANTNGRRL